MDFRSLRRNYAMGVYGTLTRDEISKLEICIELDDHDLADMVLRKIGHRQAWEKYADTVGDAALALPTA